MTYELSERIHAINHGGIGMMLKLARNAGVVDEIDRSVHLRKMHAPYQESDHVMAHVLNILCGGTRLGHLELLRNNEALLNAVGADSIPDPTTAGNFCRRFTTDDLDLLTSAIHAARLNVWRQQPDEFFNEAVIEVPCQVIRHARRTVYRLLNWTDLTPVFFRLCDSLQISLKAVELETDRHKCSRSGHLRQPAKHDHPNDRIARQCPLKTYFKNTR